MIGTCPPKKTISFIGRIKPVSSCQKASNTPNILHLSTVRSLLPPTYEFTTSHYYCMSTTVLSHVSDSWLTWSLWAPLHSLGMKNLENSAFKLWASLSRHFVLFRCYDAKLLITHAMLWIRVCVSCFCTAIKSSGATILLQFTAFHAQTFWSCNWTEWISGIPMICVLLSLYFCNDCNETRLHMHTHKSLCVISNITKTPKMYIKKKAKKVKLSMCLNN